MVFIALMAYVALMAFIAFMALMDVVTLMAWMAITALIDVMAVMTRIFYYAKVANMKNRVTELPHMVEMINMGDIVKTVILTKLF